MENRRILIIDEDEDIVEGLAYVLKMNCYEPVIIQDEFTIAFTDPAVIIVELNVLIRNGYGYANTISQMSETKRIPIIGMSNFFRDEFGFLLNICGITRFLRKPFKPVDVVWAIENVAQRVYASDKEIFLERT